jgi:CrcB protein
LLKYVAIAIGGALGSIARYWVESTIGSHLGTRFWYGTLFVNLSACMIIGFSLTVLARRTEVNPLWRFLIPVGFVGAYSTFSTFEWEILSGLETGAVLLSSLYVAMSIAFGLVAVWCGTLLGKAVS